MMTRRCRAWARAEPNKFPPTIFARRLRLIHVHYFRRKKTSRKDVVYFYRLRTKASQNRIRMLKTVLTRAICLRKKLLRSH